MPPPAIGPLLAVVLTVWLSAAVIGACWILERPAVLHHWVVTDLRPWCYDELDRIGVVGLAVALLVPPYLVIAIHELGHAAAGLCVGFRLRSIRIGALLFNPPFRVTLLRGPDAFGVGGAVEMIPVATDKLGWRAAAMILGGPATTALSAVVVFLLPGPMTFFSGCFIAFSVVTGIDVLFSYESRAGVSDGRRIRMFLWQRERFERYLALMRLVGEIDDGVPFESLSADVLAKAVAVRDESIDTVTAHALAYEAALHQHKDNEAARLLETCLAYSRHATPWLRAALMSDAAVFQGRQRKRADLAEQWLAEIPVATQSPWLRTLAEAAILEAKGDVGGALSKLAHVEAAITAITTVPDKVQRDALLRSLQRWKSELGHCGTGAPPAGPDAPDVPRASSAAGAMALTVVLWVAWLGVTLAVDFLAILMLAFADSPGSRAAVRRMIVPTFVWFAVTFVAGAVLLWLSRPRRGQERARRRRWRPIAAAFVLAVSPPFLIFAGFNLLPGAGGGGGGGSVVPFRRQSRDRAGAASQVGWALPISS